MKVDHSFCFHYFYISKISKLRNIEKIVPRSHNFRLSFDVLRFSFQNVIETEPTSFINSEWQRRMIYSHEVLLNEIRLCQYNTWQLKIRISLAKCYLKWHFCIIKHFKHWQVKNRSVSLTGKIDPQWVCSGSH